MLLALCPCLAALSYQRRAYLLENRSNCLLAQLGILSNPQPDLVCRSCVPTHGLHVEAELRGDALLAGPRQPQQHDLLDLFHLDLPIHPPLLPRRHRRLRRESYPSVMRGQARGGMLVKNSALEGEKVVKNSPLKGGNAREKNWPQGVPCS